MDPGPDVGVYSSFMVFLTEILYKNQEWSYVLCIDWMSQISIDVSLTCLYIVTSVKKKVDIVGTIFLKIAKQDDKINSFCSYISKDIGI